MNRDFHDSTFDDATRLKLEIFRGYVREWLPVFLSKASHPTVSIYDFFSGPGTDSAGNPGSPLVIVDELKRYMADPSTAKAPGVEISLHFSDADQQHATQLRGVLGPLTAGTPFRAEVAVSPFPDSLYDHLPAIRAPRTASLLLLDQFGVKHVAESVFRELMACPTTDVLFFISSSFVRRFISEGQISQYFPQLGEEIRSVNLKNVHRYLCREFYGRLIPSGTHYHVAPFSIMKGGGSNVYGLVFGSGSLLGLEKFLRVCWNHDQVTGEANYNIDDDTIRDGQPSLWPEENVIRKQDVFRRDLEEYLRAGRRDNRQLYRFALENGFLPKHLGELLRDLQGNGRLVVASPQPGTRVRAGAFYISWEHYIEDAPKAYFQL